MPGSVSQTFTRFPGRGFASLPTVSFVVPNLCHDMHGCGVPVGDTWLRAQMAGYARWATTHDSLLILTWDEDDGHYRNRIPTIFIGQMVRPGRYATATRLPCIRSPTSGGDEALRTGAGDAELKRQFRRAAVGARTR